MTTNQIVDRETWLESRRALLAREKAHTRRLDELARKRRELPWVLVDQDYRFDGPDGEVSLGDLFGESSQLIVQHFMFGPDWKAGCPGCSLSADNVDNAMRHLEGADVAFVAVSRAPWTTLAAFKERMGWTFNWVSSFGRTFNSDYGVSVTADDLASGRELTYNYRSFSPESVEEMPGISVFYKDNDGAIYHTYSAYARGAEQLDNALNLLDMAPLGRNEQSAMDWVRLHDSYDTATEEG